MKKDKKLYVLYNSFLINVNYSDKVNQWLSGDRNEGKDGLQKDARTFWGMMEMLGILVVVVVSQVFTSIKTHQIIHLKYI